MTMTNGEMVVWAGAFVANLDKHHPDLAALRGHEAVESMRAALDRCNNPGKGKYDPAWVERVREQLAPAVPMLREMLGLPALVTALPPLPDGFQPAPDYSEPPPGWKHNSSPLDTIKVVYHPELGSDSLEGAWTRHKAEHDPGGYVLVRGTGVFAGDEWAVDLMTGGDSGRVGLFDSEAEARAFAWRCAEKPHHVAFYETYMDPSLSVALEWTDEQLLAALNYIAERDHWRTREPVRPAFFPYCDE